VPSTTPVTLPPYTTPDWFQGAVLYEIFVRSYVDSDGDGVGDLRGIIDRLDYLVELGVDVIWLMPIYPSPSVHGYDVTDYFSVNPEYGTVEDLMALVEAAHDRDLRLLLDFVPSHLSDQHPFFQDAYENPDSVRSDWFVFNNDAQTTYAGFAGNREMPRFNHYNTDVVSFLTDAARFWLDLDGDGDYTDGVDGFRVDNATFPPQEFLRALRGAVKDANPEALLLGEVWVQNPGDLSRFFPDQFDALFDFPLYTLLQGDHNANQDGLLAGQGFPPLLTGLMEEEKSRFPEEAMAVRFLSNHDTNRIAAEVGGETQREKLGAAILATLPGPILVYYGEEIGMPGQKGGAPFWDNYRREPMDWFAEEVGLGQTTWFRPEDRWNAPSDGVSVEEQDSAPDSLLNYYRKALTLRSSHSALRDGDFEVLPLTSSGPGTWGFLRTGEGSSLVVLINFSTEPRELTADLFPFTAGNLRELLSGQIYPGATSGEPYTIRLSPGEVLILSSP
jgi:glycosidase